MEDKEAIKKVDKPTDWVNSCNCRKIQIVKLRIWLDPRDLNKAIKREHFQLPIPLKTSQADCPVQQFSASLMQIMDNGKYHLTKQVNFSQHFIHHMDDIVSFACRLV